VGGREVMIKSVIVAFLSLVGARRQLGLKGSSINLLGRNTIHNYDPVPK